MPPSRSTLARLQGKRVNRDSMRLRKNGDIPSIVETLLRLFFRSSSAPVFEYAVHVDVRQASKRASAWPCSHEIRDFSLQPKTVLADPETKGPSEIVPVRSPQRRCRNLLRGPIRLLPESKRSSKQDQRPSAAPHGSSAPRFRTTEGKTTFFQSVSAS